jgi:hypothetical protein
MSEEVATEGLDHLMNEVDTAGRHRNLITEDLLAMVDHQVRLLRTEGVEDMVDMEDHHRLEIGVEVDMVVTIKGIDREAPIAVIVIVVAFNYIDVYKSYIQYFLL